MKTFDTVAKLKLAKLKTGQFVETGGYHTKGDAGGAKYLIVAPQAFDGYGDHELTNGNVAVLQTKDIVNVKLYGAKGDGLNDDTSAVQAAIDARPKGGMIFFPKGEYSLTNLTINGRYQNITLTGEGREVTKLLAHGAAGTWLITNSYDYDYFGAFGMRDLTIEGREDDYTCNGVSTDFTQGNHFENLGFKFLDTCLRGIHAYQGSYSNIRFWRYNTGIRGLTTAEGTAISVDPNDAPMAENMFSSLSFYGGNTITAGAKAIVSTGFNGNAFNLCTFSGNTLHGLDLSIGVGGFTFTSCRFERMAPNTTWVHVGTNCAFYACEVWADSTNCWWTPSEPDGENWAFVISGDGNYIDGFSPEYPRQLVKLEGNSRNNDITWIPNNGDEWLSGTWFVNPIMDEGDNNTVRVGKVDRITNRTEPSTDRSVQNVLVDPDYDQAFFTTVGATKTHEPLVMSSGPYNNESVYSYQNPTGDRIVYGTATSLVSNAWYCLSMWVAVDSLDSMEVFFGDGVLVGENFSEVRPSSNNKWMRVFKMFKTTTTTVNAGFRMSSSATGKLFVSQPQISFCGYKASDILVGAYVPAVNGETSAANPNKKTAYHLINETTGRGLGSTYTNTSGKEITVYVTSYNSSTTQAMRAYINDILVLGVQPNNPSGYDTPLTFLVKPGDKYRVEWSGGVSTLSSWYEYR